MSAEESSPEPNPVDGQETITNPFLEHSHYVSKLMRANPKITKSHSFHTLQTSKNFGKSPQTPHEVLEILSSLSSGNTSPTESDGQILYRVLDGINDPESSGTIIERKVSDRRIHKGKTMSYNNSPVGKIGDSVKKSKFCGDGQIDTPTRLIMKGPDTFTQAFGVYSEAHNPKNEVKELIKFSKMKSRTEDDPGEKDKKEGLALFESFSMKDLKEYLKNKK